MKTPGLFFDRNCPCVYLEVDLSHRERNFRIVILASWEAVCFFHGGVRTAFYGFLLFGLLAFSWYTIIDTWHRFTNAVGRAVSRPNVTNQTLNVNVSPDEVRPSEARRGSPVTTDDFAAMIEYRRHQ